MMRKLLIIFFPFAALAQLPESKLTFVRDDQRFNYVLAHDGDTDTLAYETFIVPEGPPGARWLYTLTLLDSSGTTPPDTVDTPCASCKDGANAYDIWLGHGNTGTEQDFLNSLKGEPGVCPSCPPGGSEGPWKYSYMRYGAKGDGSTDDTQAIQATHNAAGNSKVIAEPGSYVITKTIVVKGNGQLWQSFEGFGGTTTMIIYKGPSNSAAYQILGLKSSKWENLNISLQGQTGVACLDLTTKVGNVSISDNAFETMRFQLGNGAYNVGVRTGWGEDPHEAGNGADISDLVFRNIRVTGSKATGQTGWLNVGRNTLNNVWEAGFWNALDYGYSNVYEKDGVKIRGNAGVTFLAVGTSGNNCVFYFGFEGGYTIEGGRYELDLLTMKTEAGNHSQIITFTGVDMSNLQGSTLFEVNAAASLNITNCRMSKRGGAFTDLVKVTHPTASVIITGGATLANSIITGAAGYKSVKGLGKWQGTPGVSIGSYYPDL